MNKETEEKAQTLLWKNLTRPLSTRQHPTGHGAARTWLESWPWGHTAGTRAHGVTRELPRGQAQLRGPFSLSKQGPGPPTSWPQRAGRLWARDFILAGLASHDILVSPP